MLIYKILITLSRSKYTMTLLKCEENYKYTDSNFCLIYDILSSNERFKSFFLSLHKKVHVGLWKGSKCAC